MLQLSKLPAFRQFPFSVQVALVAVVLAGIGGGGYAGLVAPKQREITNIKAQLAREEAAGRQPAQQVPPITEEERRLWGQLEARLRERFPADKALPRALGAVADLARSARMELIVLHLEPPARKSTGTSPGAASPPVLVPPPLTLSSTSIKLTALHRYRDLVQFLEDLDRLPVAVVMESLEVKRVETRLSTEMTLRMLSWGAS